MKTLTSVSPGPSLDFSISISENWVAVQVTSHRGQGHIMSSLLQATQLVNLSVCVLTYLLTTVVVDNILDLDALTEEQEQVLNMISVEYGMRGMDYSEYVTPLTLSLCLLLVLILC